jgi:tRNA(fMet)-specific endonuclease VapC
MARLMLDTNVSIHIIKGNVPEIRDRLEVFPPQEVAISSIVEAELWVGVMKSRLRQRSQEALKWFLSFVDVLDWPTGAAILYGEIRAQLEKKGRPIGALDLLIAAHAMYEHAILATRNRREFERVDGLRLEVW